MQRCGGETGGVHKSGQESMAAILRNERCVMKSEEYKLRRCVATLAKYAVNVPAKTSPGTARGDARSVLLFLQSLKVVGAVLHQFLSAQALITANKRILL